MPSSTHATHVTFSFTIYYSFLYSRKLWSLLKGSTCGSPYNVCLCMCVYVYYIYFNCNNQTWPNVFHHTLAIFLLNNKMIFKLIIKSLYHSTVCSPCSKSRMPRSQNALSGSACRLGNSNSFCFFVCFCFFFFFI